MVCSKCLKKLNHTRQKKLILTQKIDKIGEEVISVLCKIHDPEIPVNIYDLGLIYKIEILEGNKVKVDMTLTSPNCPVADWLPESVKQSIMRVEGVTDVDLKLVWEPPWDKSKMSEAALVELNLN